MVTEVVDTGEVASGEGEDDLLKEAAVMPLCC